MPRASRGRAGWVLAGALAVLVLVLPACSQTAGAQSPLPGKQQWYADVRAAMRGSQAYVTERVGRGGGRLAINLDIDNTTLASFYDHGRPIPRVRRFVDAAWSQGVTILFDTGRSAGRLSGVTARLRNDGLHPAEVCGKRAKEALAHSKQRCRRHFVHEGYTIIANVGNLPTDFVGGNYERAFRLPNYGLRLG